jgi:hypothetical protein
MPAAMTTPVTSLITSSIGVFLLSVGLETLAQVPVRFLSKPATRQHVAPGVQVRSGRVPLRLAEHDDHRIRTDFLDQLRADPLHGTVSV